MGGDEFIVLILGDLDTAREVAERIRLGVMDHDFGFKVEVNNHKQKVSVSCGITPYIQGQNLDEFLQNADRAMYQAKTEGKNTVVSF